MDDRSGGHTCVVGLGWGDEGKGKIIDLLCPAFDVVVRYNGGANAGHTVCVGDETFALHQLPSGVLRANTVGVVGPGTVLDLPHLVEEIDGLAARGVSIDDRLRISDRAHLVMPFHKLEDQLAEQTSSEEGRLGTTARGIGPCYADKMRRQTAVRVGDLADRAAFRAALDEIARVKSTVLAALYGYKQSLDAEQICRDQVSAFERIAPHVTDTTAYLRDRLGESARLLFEGANGTLLDVDHGTYPFVTSSNTGAFGVAAGAGVAPTLVVHRVGVIKSYATRVGAGPFVSELGDATGDRIRQQGNEYGTTTGRPRRCGWFDAVATRYSAELNDVSEIALMHLDTLTGLSDIGICVGYESAGVVLPGVVADAAALDAASPVLETHRGWEQDLRTVGEFAKLPDAARRYVDRIEELVGAPIGIVSVGPDRGHTLIRDDRSAVSAMMATPADAHVA